MERIVLAYSGGFGTSVAIPWLVETLGAEVIALTLDMGQGCDLGRIRDRALAAGALRAHVLDVRHEFATEYILPALQAGALYEDRDPLATALGRPLIARKLIEIAALEQAGAVAHGSRANGTHQVSLGVSSRALNPKIRVIAPARIWGMTRPDEIAYARARGIAVPAEVERSYGIDENLWGRSTAHGVCEDPWVEPPEEIYALTKSPSECADLPAYVEIELDRGVPTMVNGIPMPLTELITSLATIAGAHGVGRIDVVENRLEGLTAREIHEAPAAVLLHAAHRALEDLVIAPDLQRLKRQLALTYADVVYNGLWFSPTREAIDAFVAKVQERVSGTIRAKLWKADCRIVGRRSAFTLHEHSPVTDVAGDGVPDRAAVNR